MNNKKELCDVINFIENYKVELLTQCDIACDTESSMWFSCQVEAINNLINALKYEFGNVEL